MKRIAALALPSLLNRCHAVFSSYIVDEALRGTVPFPRYVRSQMHAVIRSKPSLLPCLDCEKKSCSIASDAYRNS